jgi:type IV pilus assembly protein PilM
MLSTDRILALDIGAATIKIGEFRVIKGRGLQLLNFSHAGFGIETEQETNRRDRLVTSLRNALQARKIKTKRVVLSVSGQSVFTRFVKLPPVEETKLLQIIQYEAQQNVPFPIDDVVWDYQLIGKTPEGELEVVLLAIKSEIIEELNSVVEAAGLSADVVDVAPMALSNAFRYNYGDTDGCSLVVDIGARTTNLLFIEKTKLFTRAIPIAGNAITQQIAGEFGVAFPKAEQMKVSRGMVALSGAYEEPEDEIQARVGKIIRNVMTRLHAEVARSINFYRSQQGGSAPAHLFLSGGSSIIPYADRFFREKLQIPVEYFNPFRNVGVAEQVSRDELARCAHFFGEVVGLGLRKAVACPIEVSLLPKTIVRRQQIRQKRPYLAAAASCLLLIPMSYWATTNKTISLKQKELGRVETELQQLKKYTDDIRREQNRSAETRKKADQIAGVVSQRNAWPNLMQELNARVTSSIWINTLIPQYVRVGGVLPPVPQPAPAAAALPEPPSPAGPRAPFGRSFVAAPDQSGGSEGAAAERPSGPQTIKGLLIDGEGLHSTQPGEDLQYVDQFMRNLRESPYIEKDGVELVKQPDPLSQAPTFHFSLRLKLRNPIPQQ